MINYVVGDATHPVGDDRKIVAHVCNDIGGWGRGFVVALSKRWKTPEAAYRRWAASGNLRLGIVIFDQVDSLITVANMVAQHDIRTVDGIPPIRYEALLECLLAVAEKARTLNASVHMPRIGCGLAGGEWVVVEDIINKTMPDTQVYVYDLPNNPIPFNP